MKVAVVIQYETEVPYFKNRFSFKIYHNQLYFRFCLTNALGNVLSH